MDATDYRVTPYYVEVTSTTGGVSLDKVDVLYYFSLVIHSAVGLLVFDVSVQATRL